MLHFSRWQAAAILAVTLLVCLAAVPNLLSAAAFAELPAWAQRKVALGYDLRGGGQYQFQVDIDAVRRMRADDLRDDARRLLREGRIGYTGMSIRDGAVEFSLREADDLPRVLSALNDAFITPAGQPGSKAPPVSDGKPGITAVPSAQMVPDVEIDVAGRTFRLSLTEAAIRERATQNRNSSAERIARRLAEMNTPYTVKRVGNDRIFVESSDPGERWRWMMY